LETLMPNLGFTDLVKRAGQGEQQAASDLMERYAPALRRQIRFTLMDNKLRRVLEETDICQSVMGQFFSGLSAGHFVLDGPEQLIGLLKQMVRNKITDHARYWRAGRRDYLRNITPSDSDRVGEPLCPQPTPSRIVENSEFLTQFESRLSDWERMIFAFRRQGMNWPEIASRTGGGSEAIRKRFERALDRVGRMLDTTA
jgi:DNA-directed RNA polymerase specialized sigma24 family protein